MRAAGVLACARACDNLRACLRACVRASGRRVFVCAEAKMCACVLRRACCGARARVRQMFVRGVHAAGGQSCVSVCVRSCGVRLSFVLADAELRACSACHVSDSDRPGRPGPPTLPRRLPTQCGRGRLACHGACPRWMMCACCDGRCAAALLRECGVRLPSCACVPVRPPRRPRSSLTWNLN